MRLKPIGTLVHVEDTKTLRKNFATWPPSKVFKITGHGKDHKKNRVVWLDHKSIGIPLDKISTPKKEQITQYKKEVKSGIYVRGVDLALMNGDHKVIKISSTAKYAPYIKIGDKRIKKGQPYFTVIKADYPYSPLKLEEEHAQSENNVTYKDYFLKREDAVNHVILNSPLLSLNDLDMPKDRLIAKVKAILIKANKI